MHNCIWCPGRNARILPWPGNDAGPRQAGTTRKDMPMDISPRATAIIVILMILFAIAYRYL